LDFSEGALALPSYRSEAQGLAARCAAQAHLQPAYLRAQATPRAAVKGSNFGFSAIGVPVGFVGVDLQVRTRGFWYAC